MSSKGHGRGQTVVGDLTRDLYEASAAVRRVGEQLARVANQTLPRWQVLYLLAQQELTVPVVARRLGLTRQAVQRVSDELVSANLLRRSPNPDHQRSPLHALTAGGMEVLERINRQAAIWHRAVLKELSSQEIEDGRKFLQALTRLAEHPGMKRRAWVSSGGRQLGR